MQDKEKAGAVNVKKKRHFWHGLLIYVISVLVATLIWLLVNYTIWRQEGRADLREEKEAVFFNVNEQQDTLVYAQAARVTHG